MGEARQLRDQRFVTGAQGTAEDDGERQIGADVFQVIEQRDVFAQGRPGPGQQGERGKSAGGDPQRAAESPQQNGGNDDDRRRGERRSKVGGTADTGAMSEYRPRHRQAADGRAAQQIGGARRAHFVLCAAIWAARARSEEKMRMLSSLSERSWKP